MVSGDGLGLLSRQRVGEFEHIAAERDLAEVARQQSDDPIGLGVIACAQHDGSSGFFRRQGDTAHRRGAKRKESEVRVGQSLFFSRSSLISLLSCYNAWRNMVCWMFLTFERIASMPPVSRPLSDA